MPTVYIQLWSLLLLLLLAACEGHSKPATPAASTLIARLELGGFGPPASVHPYNKNVYLSAATSKGIADAELIWRVTDQAGEVLNDPWADPAVPLQLAPSPVPGTGPWLYLFAPPAPGDYRVTLRLQDPAEPTISSETTLVVQAINLAPEAFPRIFAGPDLPQKTPSVGLRASSGLDIVSAGAEVYLQGLGFDKNATTPEQYNIGGNEPDVYGKNHDHLQRQFGFSWQLSWLPADGSPAQDISERLQGEGQVVHFTAAEAGRYRASLVVADHDASGSMNSEAVATELLCLDDNAHRHGADCEDCHGDQVAAYRATAHHREGVGCESCHGPAASHLALTAPDRTGKQATAAASRSSGVCGQCHAEYAEWEKSDHADGMAYGALEIARPLLTECTGCHNARQFASTVAMANATGWPFHEVGAKRKAASRGMPDFAALPARDEAAISCVACHDVHGKARGEHLARVEQPSLICETCHREKWQQIVMTGQAGSFGSATEYPGEAYPSDNPHNTERKCLLCHGGELSGQVDAAGVRALGGHSFRMRDASADGVLGGYGPGRGPAGSSRDPSNSDDLLHVEPCQACHPDAIGFDRNGVQRQVYERWLELGSRLEGANSGVLPGVRPGDKCATCHRGGTMPFDDDPHGVLERAYTNYKLVGNDRSWGVHNPTYVLRLLDDAIASLDGVAP